MKISTLQPLGSLRLLEGKTEAGWLCDPATSSFLEAASSPGPSQNTDEGGGMEWYSWPQPFYLRFGAVWPQIQGRREASMEEGLPNQPLQSAESQTWRRERGPSQLLNTSQALCLVKTSLLFLRFSPFLFCWQMVTR